MSILFSVLFLVPSNAITYCCGFLHCCAMIHPGTLITNHPAVSLLGCHTTPVGSTSSFFSDSREVFCAQIAHNQKRHSHHIHSYFLSLLLYILVQFVCVGEKSMDSLVWVGALLSPLNSKFLQNIKTSVNEENSIYYYCKLIFSYFTKMKQIGGECQLKWWKILCW